MVVIHGYGKMIISFGGRCWRRPPLICYLRCYFCYYWRGASATLELQRERCLHHPWKLWAVQNHHHPWKFRGGEFWGLQRTVVQMLHLVVSTVMRLVVRFDGGWS